MTTTFKDLSELSKVKHLFKEAEAPKEFQRKSAMAVKRKKELPKEPEDRLEDYDEESESYDPLSIVERKEASITKKLVEAFAKASLSYNWTDCFVFETDKGCRCVWVQNSQIIISDGNDILYKTFIVETAVKYINRFMR